MTLGRAASLAGYFGLLVLWIAWSVNSNGPKQPPTALLLILSTFPLLPWLRGLLYDRRSSYMALGLMSLIYFIHGVGAVTAPSDRLPGGLEILFSVALFFGAVHQLRQKRA